MTEPLTFEQYSRKRNLTHFNPCVAKEAWDARQPEVSALTAERDALKRELEVAQAAIMEMRQAIEIAISDFASMNQIISKGGALKFPVHPYTQTPAHLQEVIDRLAAKSALEVKPLTRILNGRTAKIDPQDIGAPMLREDK